MGKLAWRKIYVTPKAIRHAISTALFESANDPVAAIKEMQGLLSFYKQHGFIPTSGTLSKDLGLQAAEKGLVAHPVPQKSVNEMAQRKVDNMTAISQALEIVTKKYGGVPADTTAFFREYMEAIAEGKANAYDVVLQRLQQAEDDTVNLISEMADKAGMVPTASAFLDQTAKKSLNRTTRISNKLYDAVDPDGTVILPTTRPITDNNPYGGIKEMWHRLITPTDPGDVTSKALSENLIMAEDNTISNPETSYRNFMTKIKPLLSAKIRRARKENQEIVGKLVQFKTE